MTAQHEHIGAPGERIHITVNVVYVRCFKNQFNYTYFARMHDDAGHALITYYSGRTWLPSAGQRLELAATVEKHKDYQGEAITDVENCVVKLLGVAAGFKRITAPVLPRSEEVRLQKQIKAQLAFIAAAQGSSNAR